MAQSIHEQVGVLAAIESECHLVQISRKMLRADFVPRSNDSALQQRECRFDRVGMNVPINVDACGPQKVCVARKR